MYEPTGQLKARAKSSEFCVAPITLKKADNKLYVASSWPNTYTHTQRGSEYTDKERQHQISSMCEYLLSVTRSFSFLSFHFVKVFVLLNVWNSDYGLLLGHHSITWSKMVNMFLP